MNDIHTSTPYRFFLVAALGTFLGTLEGSILNVALPTLAQDLSVSIDDIAWVVLAYSVTLVSLMMVFGAWASRRGYSFAYRFGYAVFLVGTAICAASDAYYPLIAGRVVQAVGSAMLQAVGLGLVTAVFPSEQRGKVLGLQAVVVSVGLMSGPPLGGFLLSHWSWQSIFVVSLPVAGAGLLLSFFVMRRFNQEITRRPMHISGAIALTTALLTGMLWLNFADEFKFLDPRMLALLIVCALAVVIFLWRESNPERALIGLDLFRIRQFAISTVAMFIMFTAMAGSLVLMPFYLQDVRAYTPQEVGLFLIILPATMVLVAPAAGRLSDRIGYRLLTSCGLGLLALGLYMLQSLEPATPAEFIVAALVVVGLGTAVFSSPNSSALMGAVPARRRPVASSIVSTTRVMGMAFGVAVATAVFSFFQAKYSGLGGEAVSFVASMHQVFKLSVGAALVGAAVSLVRSNRVAAEGANNSVDTDRSDG